MVEIIYKSEVCTVTNYLCECTDCTLSTPEYQDRLSVCFIRKGNFLFKVFRNNLDSHTGRILINKAGYEYRVAHTHTVPDQCTIFSFYHDYQSQIIDLYKNSLAGFFKKPDVQSVLISSSVSLDYLHYQIFQVINSGCYSSLQIDVLILYFIGKVFNEKESIESLKIFSTNQKKNYLSKVEQAKEYLHENFTNPVSLHETARACAMSPFHFARVFHQLADITPHQYLLQLRLQHAEYLLQNSSDPVSEIAYASGFSSPDHFSASFKIKNKISPILFRSTHK